MNLLEQSMERERISTEEQPHTAQATSRLPNAVLGFILAGGALLASCSPADEQSTQQESAPTTAPETETTIASTTDTTLIPAPTLLLTRPVEVTRSDADQLDHDKRILKIAETAREEFNQAFPGICTDKKITLISPLDNLSPEEEEERAEKQDLRSEVFIKSYLAESSHFTDLNTKFQLGTSCGNGGITPLVEPLMIDLQLVAGYENQIDANGQQLLGGFSGLDLVLIDEDNVPRFNRSVSTVLGIIAAAESTGVPIFEIAPSLAEEDGQNYDQVKENLATILSMMRDNGISTEEMLMHSAAAKPGFGPLELIRIVYGVDDVTPNVASKWYATFNFPSQD